MYNAFELIELLNKENYNCTNVSDGFEGNDLSNGWKNSGLPIN